VCGRSRRDRRVFPGAFSLAGGAGLGIAEGPSGTLMTLPLLAGALVVTAPC
jgi:hypothetical protein